VTTGLKILLDAATPGLQLTTGLKILIDPATPGLQLTTGLKILLADTSLVLGAGGLGVNLAATPGLEIAAGMKLKLADACLTLAAGGLGISDFTGDAGAGGVKGAVPAPAVGDAVKFLKGDATWAVLPAPAAGSILYSMLSLAANPGLEDGGASATQVKVATPITRTAAGIGVSDFSGDAGAGGVRGTVPAPAAGDTAAGKFLKADATWAVPAGTGVIRPGASTDHALMRWDGAGGTTAQDSTVIVVDDGSMTIPSTITVAGIAGADQIANGNFDANLNSWTNTAGAFAWAANDGGVAHASALGDLVQFAPTVNTTYKVTFTIRNWVAGTLGAWMGGMNLRLDGASSGVKERYITAQTADPLTFSSPAGANFDLDSVSVVPYTLPGQATFAAAGLLATQFPIVLGSQEQAIQKTRADGTVVGGNVRGLGAVDFQASRTAATQVVSGQYSFAAGRNNTVDAVGAFSAGTGNTIIYGGHYGSTFGFNNTLAASSYCGFASGYNNLCNSYYSVATGANAVCDHLGEHAHSSGALAAQGDAQFTTNVLMSYTADANPTEAFIAYNTLQKFTVAANTAYSCLVMVQGRKSGGGGCSMIRQVLIENNAGTTALIGAVQTVGVDVKSDAAYAVTISADDAGDYLKVMVTGKAAHSLYWVVTILATKVTV
jgi:hypothetical protein